MEEKQIFDFIHRASHDETFRKELTSDPGCVIARENFSPRVMQVLMRGAGLGLYICKQLIEAMGGHIHVESAGLAGQGSHFLFTLPRATGVARRERASALMARYASHRENDL